MLPRACPECGHGSANWIQGVNLSGRVDYFRCPECAHVWHTPRNEPDAVPTVVMQGKPRRRESAFALPLLFNRRE